MPRKKDDLEMVNLSHRAFKLRQQGMSLFDIAEELRVTEDVVRTGIRMNLDKAAELVTDGTRRDMIAMEVSRLDRMQELAWADMESGDRRAADTILRIIAQRAKLLNLEGVVLTEVHTTLVQEVDSSFAEELKRLASGVEGMDDGDGG